MTGEEAQLFNRANRFLSAGHVHGAIDALRELLSENPDNAEAHALLALCLLKAKRLYAAEMEAGLALTGDAESPLAHLAMGEVAFARSKFADAQSHFEQVRDLAPDEPRGHLALANLYAFRGKRKAAMAEVNRALALSPDDPDTIVARGDILLQGGRVAGAEAAAKAALELLPEHQDALVLMGQALLRRGKVDDAYEHAVWALHIDPSDTDALGLLAAVKARRNLALGLWWRFNTWLHEVGSTRAIVLLLGAWITQRVAQIFLDESQYPELSGMIMALWLGFVAYTWVGPMLFHNMLRRELKAVTLRRDF